jgi:hypothetical protein
LFDFCWRRRSSASLSKTRSAVTLVALSARPDQIIQPWQFGHGETKATCLWLKNLPKLTPDKDRRRPRGADSPNAPERRPLETQRSLTYPGIAEAMAQQWGS